VTGGSFTLTLSALMLSLIFFTTGVAEGGAVRNTGACDGRVPSVSKAELPHGCWWHPTGKEHPLSQTRG
jgi:hypothetical protein